MLAPGRARRYTENMKQVPVYREAVEVPALPGLFIRPLESSLLEKAQAHLDNLTKPRGSLGRLEELGRRLYAMAGGVTPRTSCSSTAAWATAPPTSARARP